MSGVDNLLNIVEEAQDSGEEALSTDGLDDLLVLEAQQSLLDELSNILDLENVGKDVENIQMMLFCIKSIDAKLRMHSMNGTSDRDLYVAEVHQAVALSGEVGTASGPSAMDMVRTEVAKVFAERIENMGDVQPVDDGTESSSFTPRTYPDGLGKCMERVMRELETWITTNNAESKRTQSEVAEGDGEQGIPASGDESDSEAGDDAGTRPVQQRRTVRSLSFPSPN